MTTRKSNFRIIKKDNGFEVQQKIYKWYLFGLKSSWVHFISWSGLESQPFLYSSFDTAIDDLLKEIKWELMRKYYSGY